MDKKELKETMIETLRERDQRRTRVFNDFMIALTLGFIMGVMCGILL